MLLEVAEGGGFADQVLGPEDPPFVRELVSGVLRRRLTLDTIHDAFGKRPAAELDAPVREALRLGLYELVFLDAVPPHAAVGETVGALPLKSHRAYVNGVLRRIIAECRKVTPDRDRGGASPRKRFERAGRAVFFFSRPVFPDPEQDPVADLAVRHSHPAFLVARWLETVGPETTAAWLEEGNRPPALVLRPRAGRVDAEELVARLAKEDIPCALRERPGGAPAVEVASGHRVLRSKAFRQGLFSVQDPRQMDAVELLAPRPGEVVWDMCAAPGGKTLQLAEALEVAEAAAAWDGEPGRVVATDRSGPRLRRLPEHAERRGLEHRVEHHVHDALGGGAPPGKPAEGFDAVLLDAPCSNTAVLDRRPEARWRLVPDTFAELAEVQRKLLDVAREHLRPGGRLVFSSCSREAEEGVGHGLRATRSPFVWLDGPDGARDTAGDGAGGTGDDVGGDA